MLITSQNAQWPLDHILEVPVLDLKTAAAFLVNRTGAGQEAAARELAVELGGLPLALEQAAAYMQATGALHRPVPGAVPGASLDLLARGEVAGYGKRVTTTWALAFDQLQRAAPRRGGAAAAAGMLRPRGGPAGLLLQPRPRTFGQSARRWRHCSGRC